VEVKFLKKAKIIDIKGKELNELDKEVIHFVKALSCDYVIVSGYISILFGRPRTTEDIDILADIKDYKSFSKIWNSAYAIGYYCLRQRRA